MQVRTVDFDPEAVPKPARFRTFWAFGALVFLALAARLAADVPEHEAAPSPFSVVQQGPIDGPPVLLIPGLGSPGSVWNQTAEALAEEGYRVHVFTLAGFAGQPPVAGRLLPRVHAALVEYAGGMAEPPVVIGHSLGGALAFWLEAAAPDRFGPIVAVDGVPFLPALRNPEATVESARPMAEQMRDQIAAMTPEAYNQQTAFTLASMITDPVMARQMAEASRGSDPATVAGVIYDLMTRDLRDDLGAANSPILLLAAGVGSPMGKEELRGAYASQVSAATDPRVVVLDEARHFIMLDAPERFLELVFEHLEIASGE